MNPIKLQIEGINAEPLREQLKSDGLDNPFYSLTNSKDQADILLLIGNGIESTFPESVCKKQFLTNEDQINNQDFIGIPSYEPDMLYPFLDQWLKREWFERKLAKTECQRKEAEERFGIFVSNNSDIVTLLNEQGEIMYQSSSIQQKMGYSQNELKGRKLVEIIHPDDLNHVLSALQEATNEEGISRRIEFRLKDKNGNYLYLEAVGNNQLRNPLIRAFIVHSHDISNRKKEEAEKNLMIQQLIHQNSDLKQFAFITTHNLRAPLTNLQAILELSEQGEPLTGELEMGLKQSIKNLEETVSDLVKILFIKEKSKPELKWIPLSGLLEKSLVKLQKTFEQTKAEISYNGVAGMQIYCNPIVLQEIIEQLLHNSLQFTKSDTNPSIRFSYQEGETESVLSISDNGTGFDAERLKDRVFGFYQKFHRNKGGKGLGLFFAQEQAKSCNSLIEVTSKEGKGSIFSIRIQHPKYK